MNKCTYKILGDFKSYKSQNLMRFKILRDLNI